MTVNFTMKRLKVPNDTVLLLGISYRRDEPGGDTREMLQGVNYRSEPGGDTRGRTNPKVFTYAALKAGGLWYLTGAGKAPQAAGWPAVERWLERDGRVVEWVKMAGEARTIWPLTDVTGLEGAQCCCLPADTLCPVHH